LILLVAGAAWLFRDRIRHEWNAMRGLREAPQVPSPELAELAAAKLQRLRAGETERVALGATELQSLVTYTYAGILPAFAQDPHIELEDDHIRLRVRVPVDRLPDVKGLGDAASFLPDTTEVALSGVLLPLSDGRAALAVDDVQAARIPLPTRMIAEALKRVGRRDEPGLGTDAIAVALPPGVGAAYIRSDSLILLAQPGS
jgi:hypothetical protein